VPTKELLELIEEIGHVGELTRLLFVFKRRYTTRLGKIELTELANQTAGASYRYPKPEEALNVALAVGLLQKDHEFVVLTETGKLFLRLQGDDKLALTVDQARLVLGLFLDDVRTSKYIGLLFRHFGRGASGRLEAKLNPSMWDGSTQIIAKLFQQLGVLEDYEGKLCLNSEFEVVFPRDLLALIGLNEEALWARLEAQRIRAKKAEELVVIEEQKRLSKIGRADLAKLVIRVSADDVSTGYDISSFNADGSQRLIEVKSSSGRAIRFEWSAREREVASENGERYWIYFVPIANIIEKRILPILMISDPITLIGLGKLFETPSSFVVNAKTRVIPSVGTETGARDMLKNWPH